MREVIESLSKTAVENPVVPLAGTHKAVSKR